jgi:hypothetical protein
MPYKYFKIIEYDAVGGPQKPEMGKDGNMQTPTRAGRFVINTIAKHVSYGKYAFTSGVEWGTPIRVENKKIQIQKNGVWTNLTSLTAFKKYKGNESDIIEKLKGLYEELKASFDKHPNVLSDAEKNSTLPNSWIFNDFGHVSIKYFKDLNNDFILNGNETLLGDFIHTTPTDEFLFDHHFKGSLVESHGCVHVRPSDINTFINNGYTKIGSVIEVKSYLEIGPIPIAFESAIGRPDYEMHFYPGLKKLTVYNVTKQ